MAWVFFVLKRQCFDTDVLVKKVSVFSEVQMIVALTGEYDFCISVFGKDMRQVAESISRIEKGLASFIELSSMVFVTRLFKFHQVVLPAPEEKPFELDALGKKVLSFMVENPKASVKEICKAISAHRNTVSKKIKQLNDSGVIIKKGLILDPETSEELGFGFKSMIFFNISPDKKELFAQKLCEFQEVHELFAISGHHDFLAIVRTKGTQELFDFHKRLLCNSELSPMIQRTISRVILRSMNLNHDPKRVLRGG
jgi:Lrp/AsnC family transcriptional regulator